MIKMDDTGLLLCKYQGDLFALSSDLLNCSSSYFYKKYAFSNLAKRMDNKRFIMESLDTPGALEELSKETDLTKGKNKAPKQILTWMGYLLRYWSYTYEISTKQIYKIVKFDELCNLYEAYHGLDVEEAINRINESHKVKNFNDYKYKYDELIKIIQKYWQND